MKCHCTERLQPAAATDIFPQECCRIVFLHLKGRVPTHDPFLPFRAQQRTWSEETWLLILVSAPESWRNTNPGCVLRIKRIRCRRHADSPMFRAFRWCFTVWIADQMRWFTSVCGGGETWPCDAAIADFICHFSRQGQCSRRVQWSCESDNRPKRRETDAIAGCLYEREGG